jgi:rubrerythrin
MTDKEAIKWLESIDKNYIHGGDEWYDEQRHEAIKTAIKALENERPKGMWLIIGQEQGAFGIIYKIRKCSKCGWEHSLVIPDNFCPKCGVYMKREEK